MKILSSDSNSIVIRFSPNEWSLLLGIINVAAKSTTALVSKEMRRFVAAMNGLHTCIEETRNIGPKKGVGKR